jgi:hypothetical protein
LLEQVICSLSDALAALHALAEVLLITGNSKQQQANSNNSAAAEAMQSNIADNDLDAKDASPPEAAAAAGAVAAAKPAKSKAAAYSRAELLAAEAAHHLHTVAQLVPAMRKEKYIGKIGSCRWGVAAHQKSNA